MFGIAFEIPVFVILLNLAGILSGRALGAHRPWIVIGTFVFAAVATPSTDPFTMLLLAIPMLILFGISEVICRVLDRRRHDRQQAGRSRRRRAVAAVTAPLDDLDPFDLPDWLGEGAVTWAAEAGVRRGHRVPGHLRVPGRRCPATCSPWTRRTPRRSPTRRPGPAPTWPGGTDRSSCSPTTTGVVLAVPGTGFTADLVLDALSRLAKAVGASPENYVALLRIGSDRR